MIHVRVDPVKCEIAGICVEMVPEVFRFQAGNKKAVVYRDPIPAELEKSCAKAALACPTGAIQIRREAD
jgi:ferredoxin